MPLAGDGAPRVRAHLFRHADEVAASRLEMHHPERRGVVEKRRDESGQGDLVIGNADRLGHDEGDGAHHRRHDLAAHAGGRLDCSGEGPAVAEADHQRDGELAGGEDVGDRRAVDGAHQSRGDHRDLRRSALLVADETEGDVVEQPDHAGALEKRAKQDEQEDVGGRDERRHAINALGAEIELVDHLFESETTMREEVRQPAAEQGIGNEHGAHQRQRPAHDAPRRLGDEDHHHGPDHDVGGVRLARPLDEIGLEDPVVQAEREGRGGQHPVVPGHGPPHVAGAEAEKQEAQEQQKADVNGAQDDRRQRTERGGDDLEEAEDDRAEEDDSPRHSRQVGHPHRRIFRIDDPARRRRGGFGSGHPLTASSVSRDRTWRRRDGRESACRRARSRA